MLLCFHRISFKGKLIQGNKLLLQDNFTDYVRTCFPAMLGVYVVRENFQRNTATFLSIPILGSFILLAKSINLSEFK